MLAESPSPLKISIVVPVRNDVRVAKALDSILHQKVDAAIDVIVVDGASTDGTLAVLEGYRSRVHRIISERDGGIYDAMNKGVSFATGDIIGILNADDRYSGNDVLSSVAAVFSDPLADACYGDLVYENALGEVVRRWRSGKARRFKYYLGWMPPHPTFFLRRRFYAEYGGFDTSFRISADYALMLNLIVKHRLRLVRIPSELVRMSKGGESNRSVRNIVRANVEVFKSWRKSGLRFGCLVPVVKPASKILQFLWH